MQENSPIEFNDESFEKNHIWHPYTSLKEPLPAYEVKSAQGVNIKLSDGKELIDGTSSWWACLHGYNHPTLNEAINKQLGNMAHVMFGGFSHQPATLLTQKLLSIVPQGLHNVFFSDSGSVSVEVGMKMALQYFASQGKVAKSKFLTARFGYHGDTTGAMSVCDPINGMHHLFKDFIPQHIFGPAFPMGIDTAINDNIINEYRHLIEENADNLAAFIIEPVVQNAGGMRIYNPVYLTKIKQLCVENDVLFIADEIATGFGRTGTLFACEQANVTPDIMCLGKALSGGYMSFAATISTKQIAHTICANPPYVFMHGPTFMANPLACAVSLSSIKLLEKEGWEHQVEMIESVLKEHLHSIPNSTDIRILGAIGIVEFNQNINVAAAQKLFVKKGVWIRPFRNLVYIMPPFIIKPEELVQLINSIKELAKNPDCFINY